MASIITETGAVTFAQALADYLAVSGNAVSVALFRNDLAITDWAIVPGDLTLANFDGSTPIASTDWGIGLAVGEAFPVQTNAPLTWTVTGTTNLPQTLYGYAVFANSGADLLWVDKFAAAIVLTTVGQVVNLTPRMLTGNCP